MFRNLIVTGLSLAVLATLQGCGAGGPSEKDTNPNPSLESNKEGPPKRGGAMPGSTPKGAKVEPGK
jgi:predicted small lipoprotein YifL